MVSTRSKTAQTHIEDFATKDESLKSKAQQSPTQTSPPKANISRKRKSPTDEPIKDSPSKRTKTTKQGTKPTKTEHPNTNNDDSKIIINRAPVLHLWSAHVTQALYPHLPWPTCLSAGSAISTICAISNGRSIGTMSAKDDPDEKQAARTKTKKQQRDLDTLHVMHFTLKLKDGLALVGSEAKGKPGGEEGLRKKFGEGEYEHVRRVFGEVLEGWEGREDELSDRAFGFYEGFRPEVGGGQKGWGRKGELDLGRVRSVVGR